MRNEGDERSWDGVSRGEGWKGDKAWWCKYV